jgi:hypothetical protein
MSIAQEAERAPKSRRSECSGEVTNLLLLPETEPRFLGRCHYTNDSGGPSARRSPSHSVVAFLGSTTNVELIPKLQAASLPQSRIKGSSRVG